MYKKLKIYDVKLIKFTLWKIKSSHAHTCFARRFPIYIINITIDEFKGFTINAGLSVVTM